MARKRATKELRQERTIIIGAGLTEQYYFSHLKKLFNVNIIVRPRFFGKENIDALEQRIEQVLETNSKAIVVFDADVSQWNAVEQTKLKALKKKYANHIQVLLCDSMPSIEYWFLLYFNYIDTGMDRKSYESKINEYFNAAGLKYRYKKNDEKIYSILSKYGSLEKARKNAYRIHLNHSKDKPSDSESCTTVYRFFDEVDKRLKELE